jgi:CubicO group peptidase (beta-lactamase class C family)
MTDFDRIWQVADGWVEQGRIPGYAAAVRIGGETRISTGGRLSLDPASAPVQADSLFRIASVTKPIAAALALSLVQDGVFGLDDPIATWLPEAAEPRVLVDPNGPLDATVPADRAIRVRDLLSFTSGWGVVMQPSPLQTALFERHLFPDAIPPRLPTDQFVQQLCSLPLAFQPGQGWLYHLGLDLLGPLIVRATGRTNEELLAERITGPLGLSDTSFTTPDLTRMATQYRPVDGRLELIDPPDGLYAQAPPIMEQLASGLVSTVGDVMRFYCAMADGGAPVLTPESLAAMTSSQLDAAQQASAAGFLGPDESWGLGTAVDVGGASPWMAPGRWGWTGGTGTTAYVDPQRGTVSVLLTQRAMASPDDSPEAFWQAVADAA